MKEIMNLFWDVCRLKKGPQDTPASAFLFRALLILYVLVSVPPLALQFGWIAALLQIAIAAIILIGFVAVLLWFAGKWERFLQTIVATLGSDVLLSVCALPLLVTLSLGSMNPLLVLAMWALILWHWIVFGHILRHALSTRLALGMALALGYILSVHELMVTVFPVPE